MDIFSYDALCEAVLCNIQPIAMHELKQRSSMYRSRKDRELMVIMFLCKIKIKVL